MNKISKKIVALVTMAAFVLTLVPAAAFAANATADGSHFTVTSDAANQLKVEVSLDGSDDNSNVRLGVSFDGIDASGVAVSATNATSSNPSVSDLTGAGVTPSNSQTNVTFTFTNVPAGAKKVVVTMSVDASAPTEKLTTVPSTGTDSVTVKGNASEISNLRSYFYTDNTNVSVEKGVDVPVSFDFANAAGETITVDNVNDAIVVWAVDEDGNLTDALNITGPTAAPFDTYGKKLTGDVSDMKVSFSYPGTYTLYAAKITNAQTTIEALKNVQFQYESARQTVVVKGEDSTVTSIAVDGATNGNNTFSATLNKANGAESITNVITANGANGVVANKTFTVSSSSSALRVTALDMNDKASADGTITTDRNGKFKVKYNATTAGTYKVYLTTEDGFRATINVTAGDNSRKVETIVANEKDVTLDAAQVKSQKNLVNAVTYTITDSNGNVLTDNQITETNTKNGKILGNVEGCVSDTEVNADYVKLISAPEDFTGKATNFGLAYVDDAYTLAYKGDAKLVPGEYTVRLILDNGKYADATFKVGNFNANKVESLNLTTTADTVTYTKNSKITYKLLAVDANGVSKDVTKDGNYTLAVDAAQALAAQADTSAGTVTITGDVAPKDKESVVGTKINLVAASDYYGKLVATSVTVVDENVAAGIEFDSEAGEVNTNNTVKATVVDENGKTVEVNGKVFAYVVDQTNADAKVDVTANGNASKGVGTITIFSDKATTVDVVVGIQKDSSDPDSAIYADTLTYTIGEKDVNADKMVAMTIGSTDMIVNNELVNGDAAPYVADSRTMVPIRALTETFGAKVDYDNDAKTVTIVDGDTTVVMTIGEKTYTVNGEEKTMDVAPVIGSGDRTYVPVRFVAEALGYKVTPLYAADGTTASVVFQK